MSDEGWRQLYARLARMERDEIAVRIRQESAKRLDAIRFRFGFDFARRRISQGSCCPGKFFFLPESVPAILSLLRQRLPQTAEQILKEAEKICEHRFNLLGYEDLEYGDPIDWYLDAVHGKRAPRKPFYKIRYLDFQEVGDSKITWELNRHQHLVTLAKAYRLTLERCYADEIFRQWHQWHQQNPYPLGINWASSLEVAFRSLSWIWMYHLLEGSPALVSDFRQAWLRAQALNGRHIERYLSTYFSPNTHLLGEAVALFFLGILCPELSGAEHWKTLGWKTILREAGRQVHADGFHFEQSTYYHVYAIDFFLHATVLASANEIAIPRYFEEILERMLSVLFLLGRAGTPPRLGDDDGGRVFDPRRNRSEHLLDPLATGAILFNRSEFKVLASDVREETIWLLGAPGLTEWDRIEAKRPEMGSIGLPATGLYLLATPKPCTQLVIDAGPQGTQSGGHGHADALSLCLQSEGRALLIDPGTFEYVGEGGARDLFRSTAMHNTLRVDGASQSEPDGPFAWRRLTQSTVEQWTIGETFDLFAASHDGYTHLASTVVHRRWVFSLKRGLFLIRDVVEGEGKHRLDISWHLSPEVHMTGTHIFRVKGAAQGLVLLPVQGHGWAEEVHQDAWSPAYGKKKPLTVLNFGTNASLPAEFATVLVPVEEVHCTAGTLTRLDGQAGDSLVRAYGYCTEASEHHFFFGEKGKSWRWASVASDAEFVSTTMNRDRNEQIVIFCNGSYVEIDGLRVLQSRRSVSRCELIVREKERQFFCSEREALDERSTDLARGSQASELVTDEQTSPADTDR